MPRTITINGRTIGPSHPTYIVAEMSANHNQDFDRAIRLLEIAKEVGADAVKLQTYTADSLTIDSDREYFRVGKGTLWEGKTLYGLYQEAFTPWEWQPRLMEVARQLKIDLFSTPFDEPAIELLEKMEVPAHKVASFEMVDLGLIRRVARTGKPMIMSTGMCTLAEIEDAVNAAREGGATDIVLLKCTSAYPAPPEDANLSTIPHLAEAFDVATGLSDHTPGHTVPVAAVTLGACVVEKHFTISRADGGPDSAFSLEPDEFKALVAAVRIAERAVGRVHYGVAPAEAASRNFRRSLFVVRDVKAGELFTADNVRSIRPGHGLPPKFMTEVLGRRAAEDIARGTPLTWSLLRS